MQRTRRGEPQWFRARDGEAEPPTRFCARPLPIAATLKVGLNVSPLRRQPLGSALPEWREARPDSPGIHRWRPGVDAPPLDCRTC